MLTSFFLSTVVDYHFFISIVNVSEKRKKIAMSGAKKTDKMFVLLNFNNSKDNRACEHVGKMWADRQEGSSFSQTGELDSSDRKKSDKTEWGHAGITKTGRLKHTHTHTQQCSSLQKL